MRVVLVFAALFGCGAEARPPFAAPSQNPPSPSVGPPRAAVSTEAPASARSLLVFEPLAAPKTPVPPPKLEILEPGFGETLDPKTYRSVPVRMRTENTKLTSDAEGVLISLDGKRARRLLPEARLSLGDLLSEDEELEVGPHALFAVAVDGEGRALREAAPNGWRALSLVDFFVGVKKAEVDTTSPRLLCLSPVGTHYVPRGSRLLLDVLPLGFSPESAKLRAEASGFAEVRAFDPRLPQFISGLPFGDVVLSVTAEPGTRARCVVTLNPAEDGTE